MFSKIKNYIYAAIFSLLPIIYMLGRKHGSDSHNKKEMRRRIDVLEKSNEIDKNIQIMDDVSVTNRLNEWMRD